MTAVFQTLEFGKLQETKLGRLVTLILLSLIAMTTVGCSTPEVNSRNTTPTRSAYQACVEQLSIYGRQNECASTTYTIQNYQTPNYYQYNQQYGYTYLNGKLTQREESEVMADYLETLDEASAKELTIQLKNLAAEATLLSASK